MNPSEQLELTPPPAPKINTSDLDLLIYILTGKGWMTAKCIWKEAWYCHKLWSKRHIRAIASNSQGQIISGQNGYRLTRESTIEEVQHASAWIRHQAAQMQTRALQIDRVYHRKIQP